MSGNLQGAHCTDDDDGVIAVHDTLFCSLLVYANAHLKILVDAFRTLRLRCLEELGEPEQFETFRDEDCCKLVEKLSDEFRKCSKHLQTIIR